MSILSLFETPSKTFDDHAKDFMNEMRTCGREIQSQQRKLQRDIAKQQREIQKLGAKSRQSETQQAMGMLRCARLAAGYQLQINRLDRIKVRFENAGHQVAMARAQTSSIGVMQRASKSLKKMNGSKLDIPKIQRVCHEFEKHLSMTNEKAGFTSEMIEDSMDNDLDADSELANDAEDVVKRETVQMMLNIAPPQGMTKAVVEQLYNQAFCEVPSDMPTLKARTERESDALLLELPAVPR